MKKYFLKESNQEVKVGNKIQLVRTVDTSYGKGKVTTDVYVSEKILAKLIKDGFVRVEEEKSELELTAERLKPYIKKIADKCGTSFATACVMIDTLAETYPKVAIQLFIDTIAETKNRGKSVEKPYCLNPVDHYKPTICYTTNSGFMTMFCNKEDATDTYKLLYPYIKELFNGKQEG